MPLVRPDLGASVWKGMRDWEVDLSQWAPITLSIVHTRYFIIARLRCWAPCPMN